MRLQPNPRGEVRVCLDLDEVSREAAALVCSLAQQSVQRTGKFTAALSGGATPQRLYRLLAAAPFREQIAWPAVDLFWADERCVPPDHPDSNYCMVQDLLLAHVPLPPENVHRMRGEEEPVRAAESYERELRSCFGLLPGAWPRFDLVLLGLGADGHTASLFPGSPAVQEDRRLVVANYIEDRRAHRLTLTFPAINHAASVVFLVSGGDKAPALRSVLESQGTDSPVPAARIHPTAGRAVWIVDEAAVGLSLA